MFLLLNYIQFHQQKTGLVKEIYKFTFPNNELLF